MPSGPDQDSREPLFSGTGIRLFGRLVAGLTIDLAAAGSSLGNSLPKPRSDTEMDKPGLARIYGFAYEGHYYDLARPALFLVYGPGDAVGTSGLRTDVPIEPPRLAADMRAWVCDQADFSLRLDVDVGPLERILLEAELESDPMRLDYAGQKVRGGYAGQKVQLRYAGQKVQLRGGRSGGLSD